MGKNNKDTSFYMNNRIPRKKTASAQSNASVIQYSSISTANQQPATTNDTLSLRTRKSKDGAPSSNNNKKKRTHDMSFAATTKPKPPKKVKNTAISRDKGHDASLSSADNIIPTYQIVKEGRISGYPIIVSQVGSEHDAILLGCKDNPQDYLNNNKDGKVKIRWKFAGYNGLVPTHTVRLKLVDGAPPIRKAAVMSGLLETDEVVATDKDDIDLGEEEDNDAPILKVVRADLLDSTGRADKDDDYYDQEDRDEKLVCYERSAYVGYQGGNSRTSAAASTDGKGSEDTSSNQESDNVEGAYTEFDPQVDQADTNSHKAAPSIVTSQSGIKLEDGDVDSVATDPMVNEEVVPMEVKSDMNLKTEGEETDDDELKPSVSEVDTNSHKPTPPVVTSQSGIKAEDDDIDSVATDRMVNADALSLLAAYGDDTDDDELKPSVKLEGENTDDALDTQLHTSSNDVKMEGEAAYECDTDNDEPKPLEVTSEMNLKSEEVDTDDEMGAQQVEPVASNADIKKEGGAAYGDDTDNDESKPLEVKSEMNVKEEEDTDDMNTSSLSHDDLFPTVSASTSESEEDNTIVLEFFEKFNSCLEERTLDDETEEMIKANPYLLNSKCPQDMDNILKGSTAMETVCQQEICPDTRDLLYELVLLGGKATDKCYEVLNWDFELPVDHLTVLLLSGYYPTKRHYSFLDELAEGFENDDDGLEPVEMLSILYKTVKLGDNLSCGPVDSTVIINNINQLPPLEDGVTHSKGGTINPMEDLLKQYPVDKVRIEHEEMQRKARAVFKMHDEEEKEKSEEMERKNKGEKKKQMERNPGHNEKPIKSGLKWTPPDHSTSRVSNTQQPLEKGGKHKEVNGNEGTSGIKWTPPNRSTGNVHEEVYLKSTASIPPQEHDMVIVTRGGDVGVEGELVCIDGTDAILKDPNQNFKIVAFTHLATTRRVKVQKDCPGGRKCSVCEMKKDRTDFSKTQWKKGDDAKCKECIALKHDPEVQKKLAEERNKLLAAVYNKIGARRCSKCGIIKKKDEFKCQWSRQGPCKDCIAKKVESQRIAMEEEKKRKLIRRQSTIEENKKSERLLYNQKKERYEQYKKEMEENGRSIEKEMISSTDLVYVVTSVQRREHPFSLCLHGIYTTCKRAQESARRAFAKESLSYRDGNFLPNDERIAKCDTSEFLVPGIAFNSRVMFELFGEEDDVYYTSVAVTAIKVDVEVNAKLPCLGPAYEDMLDVGERKDIKHPLKLGKVYAIFIHSDGDVKLSGVYTNRNDAIASGLRYANFDDKEVEREQIENALTVSNGRLFHDEEYYESWQVAMETATLNENVNYNGELDLGMHGYGCWVCPDVEANVSKW